MYGLIQTRSFTSLVLMLMEMERKMILHRAVCLSVNLSRPFTITSMGPFTSLMIQDCQGSRLVALAWWTRIKMASSMQRTGHSLADRNRRTGLVYTMFYHIKTFHSAFS